MGTIIILALYIGLCVLVGKYGKTRVIGFWGFFILSLLLTPAIIFVILLISKERKPKEIPTSVASGS
jgi:hypothetical protein